MEPAVTGRSANVRVPLAAVADDPVTHSLPCLPTIGELELKVLEHLWARGEADVTGTHAAVGRRRIMPNTVGSALERLFRKGLVKRQKVSHAYRYSPAFTRDEFMARRVLDAAGGVTALVGPRLRALVDLLADADETALDRLQSLIARKRAERGRS